MSSTDTIEQLITRHGNTIARLNGGTRPTTSTTDEEFIALLDQLSEQLGNTNLQAAGNELAHAFIALVSAHGLPDNDPAKLRLIHLADEHLGNVDSFALA